MSAHAAAAIDKPSTRRSSPTLHRRRAIAWQPGWDTLAAVVSVFAMWLAYYLGAAREISGALEVGILLFGTALPALVVFRWLKGSWADLGITRHRLVISLVVAVVLGGGSVYQAVTLAGQSGADLTPHLLANLLVFWEPFFIFGWLFLRWEKAFGFVAAPLLVAVGFTLQHVGAVPLAQAAFFGVTSLVFGIIFATTRNLAILWPLFYPVASAIGTLQAGFTFGWDAILPSLLLMVGQFAILLIAARLWRSRPVDR